MNNVGTTIAKIAAAAGGAVLGILLARLGDDFLASRSQEKSEFDKTRYEQGLAARKPEQAAGQPILQPPLANIEEEM